jgi:hypothetical protein
MTDLAARAKALTEAAIAPTGTMITERGFTAIVTALAIMDLADAVRDLSETIDSRAGQAITAWEDKI